MVVPKPKGAELKAQGKPSKSRVNWARLLKRVFGIDVETCNQCGDKMKIIAAIEDPQVIKQILTHLGLPTRPPTPWPARGPPPTGDHDLQQFPIDKRII